MDLGVERTVPLAIPLSPNDANRGKSFGQGPAQRTLALKADDVVAPPKRTNTDTPTPPLSTSRSRAAATCR